MTDTQAHDPWDWDIDRVIHEFCIDGSIWRSASASAVLPDVVQLEASLRENLVDGACLLTTIDDCDFFGCLGITALKHRSTVRTAIRQLRISSNKFQIHKRRLGGEEVCEQLDSCFVHEKRKLNAISDNPELHEPANAATTSPSQTNAVAGGHESAVETGNGVHTTKRRRVVPALLSTVALKSSPEKVMASSGLPYYGVEAMGWPDIVDTSTVEKIEMDTHHFMRKSRLSRGRAHQVNGVFKRSATIRRRPRHGPSTQADLIQRPADNEDILPALGQSDPEADSEWEDEEFLAELREDESETVDSSASPRLLEAEIIAILDEHATKIAAAWKERKATSLRRKAYGVWKNSRGNALNRVLRKIRGDLEAYETRFSKLRREILAHHFLEQAEVHQYVKILDPTIEDRCHAMWILEVLRLTYAPERIAVIPRLRNNRLPRGKPAFAPEEEDLHSDSDPDAMEFVVEDELSPELAMDLNLDGRLERRGYDGGDDDGDGDYGCGDDDDDDGYHDDRNLENTTTPQRPSTLVKTERSRTILPSASSTPKPLHDPRKTSPNFPTSKPETIVIDLTTPSPSRERSPVAPSSQNEEGPRALARRLKRKFRPRPGVRITDDQLLMLNLLGEMKSAERRCFLKIIRSSKYQFTSHHKGVWNQFVQPLFGVTLPDLAYDTTQLLTKDGLGQSSEVKDFVVGFQLVKWFLAFTDGGKLLQADNEVWPRRQADVVTREARFEDFVVILRKWSNLRKLCESFDERNKQLGLVTESREESPSSNSIPATTSQEPLARSMNVRVPRRTVTSSTRDVYGTATNGGSLRQSSILPESPPTQSTHHLPQTTEDRNVEPTVEVMELSSSSEPEDGQQVERSQREFGTVSSRKAKAKLHDQAAQNLRESDMRRVQEQDQRRELLRSKLAAQGQDRSASDGQKVALIINETKEDHEGFVYVNDSIAKQIKPHQIEGIRFIWNQLVTEKGEARQGCLLAHAMGLGKSMQIITFLLAVSDAANSPDLSVSSQIPDDLKESCTILIVPASLVDNWIDEFLIWAPQEHKLGDLFKICAQQKSEERHNNIDTWAKRGGVLIMPYTMFTHFISNGESPASTLLNRPNLIIADEAHKMKNKESKTQKTMNRFRSLNRIALTGTPLANNVLEYYSMINWVAPNYLSDEPEFNQNFATPIEKGLGLESTPSERRRAKTCLRALKKTLEPKVNRATIAVMKDSMVKKKEFVITLPLSETQFELYNIYMKYQMGLRDSGDPNARVFAMTHPLSMLTCHPNCFKSRLIDAKTEYAKKEYAKGTVEVTEEARALPPVLVSDCLAKLNVERDVEALELSWKATIVLKLVQECEKVGDSILIFSRFTATLDYLERLFKLKQFTTMRLDGKTKMASRQDLVKSFNTGGFAIFFISTKAGGTGLNITGANRVIVFDFGFNPQEEQQAIGRAYRIGQTKPVFVYIPLVGGSFEEKVHYLSIFKLQLAKQVVDKKSLLPKAPRITDLICMPTLPDNNDVDQHRGTDGVLDSLLDSPAHRAGIRSIIMTDTFEEEDPEFGANLQEEERAVQELLDQHAAARMASKFNPPAEGDAAMNSVPNLLKTAGLGSVPATQYKVDPPSLPIPATNNASAIHSDGNRFAVAAQHNVAPQPPGPGLGHPLPTQMKSHRNGPVGVGTPVNSLDVNFQVELENCLTSDAPPGVQTQRRQTAGDLANLFEQAAKARHPEEARHARRAILQALGSKRFLEATALGLLRPMELSSWSSGDISHYRTKLDGMDQKEWEEFIKRPPVVLGNAQAISRSPPMPNQEADSPIPQNARRTDDDRVLQELQARRSSRSIKGITSGDNPAQKLPEWAMTAVANQGRLSSTFSTSSAGPAAGPSRHTAKNPFH